MASNCLAPGFARLNYSVDARPHVMTIPISPSGSGVGMLLNKKGGGTISLTDALVALLAVMVPVFGTDADFNSADWYKQVDCATSPVYQTSSALVGVVGTGGGTSHPNQQLVLTFRTIGGGRAKMQLMETDDQNDDLHESITVGTGTIGDLAEYLLSSDSWIYARDNSYLSTALNWTTKTNDVLRRKAMAI